MEGVRRVIRITPAPRTRNLCTSNHRVNSELVRILGLGVRKPLLLKRPLWMRTLQRIAALIVVIPLGITIGDAQVPMKERLTLSSEQFAANGAIPSTYTCDGANYSPPLSWSGAPKGTKSFALIVYDPDAPDPAHPQRTWVHWGLYNIPASVSGLSEGLKELPPGTREGLNDWKRTGYSGPCPPKGRHRYFHKLYALDVALPLNGNPSKAQLERSMEGHILAQADLGGLYSKQH